jgi:hypothetical protein
MVNDKRTRMLKIALVSGIMVFGIFSCSALNEEKRGFDKASQESKNWEQFKASTNEKLNELENNIRLLS